MPGKKQPDPASAKGHFKTCPHCKYGECHDKAPRCEKCGYNFLTKKKPQPIQKATIVLEEIFDESEELVGEPVATTPKLCPNCKHSNFHKAKHCERCKWDFLNESMPKQPPTMTANGEVQTGMVIGNWRVEATGITEHASVRGYVICRCLVCRVPQYVSPDHLQPLASPKPCWTCKTKAEGSEQERRLAEVVVKNYLKNSVAQAVCS